MNIRIGKAEATETITPFSSSELYEGDVRLEIKSSDDFRLVDQFQKCLKDVENLRIASNNWSEDEGLAIFISLQSPVPLGDILSQMPMVAQVYKKRANVVAVLNS